MPNEPDKVQMQKLFTVAEVADQLRRSKWGVYRMIEKGELPAVRVSNSPRGALRVAADELRDFIYGEAE